MKTRGIYRLTYNHLAQLLKLEENSIRKIYEKDQGEEALYILHDDKEDSILYNEGMAIMQKNLNFKSHIDLKPDLDLMIKNIQAGLGVKNHDYGFTSEEIFNIKLLEHQIKPISDWNKIGVRKYNWKRRTGASYCAVIDALFSACCGKLDVLYLSASRNESEDHLKIAKQILDRTTFGYRIDDSSIIFSSGYLIAFRPNSADPSGTRFSKMIFDNCDINRKIMHSKCVAVREYTTYED